MAVGCRLLFPTVWRAGSVCALVLDTLTCCPLFPATLTDPHPPPSPSHLQGILSRVNASDPQKTVWQNIQTIFDRCAK